MCAGSSTPSPRGTRAPAPTCCGWRSRRGTPTSRRKRPPSAAPVTVAPVDTAGWAEYGRGEQFFAALRDGRAARAVWQALPGERWADRLAEAAAATVEAGRGVLAIVPDQRDVDALRDASVRLVDESRVVALSAGLGPAQRYRRWLSVLRGSARLVIGTRSAVFAPVADLGLVLVWDDGDDTLSEPRAPYPHAREVGMLRAHQLRCAAMIGGYSRTAEAQAMVRSRWAHDLVAARPVVRSRAPRVIALEDSGYAQERDPAAHSARLPSMALQAARSALDAGQPGPRPGAAQGLRARAGLRPLPHHRPLQALHRPAVAARSGRVRRGMPVVRPRGTRAALRPMRVRRRPRRRRRRPPHRRRTRPGVSRHHGRHLRRRRRGVRRCRAIRPSSSPPRAPSRGRTGGYGAALLLDALGAAGPPGSACGRGHAAPLDGRGHAGPQPRRRRRGRRGRRIDGADRAGADPLGSGRARRGRARRPRRGRACRPPCTWPPSTARPRRSPHCWKPLNCPTSAELLGPVDLPPGARRPPGTPAASPVNRMLVRVPRSDGLELAAALRRATGVLSARHDQQPVRVQIDPLHIG